MTEQQKPVVKVARRAYLKMMAYAKAAPGEVSGMGIIEEIDGSLFLSEVFICKQQAAGGGVELDQEDLGRIVTQMVVDGDDESPKMMRCWWHSHNDFGCFRSGTDTDTVDRLLGTMPYVVCVVVNKKGEYELTLYANSKSDIFEPQVIEGCRFLVIDEEEDAIDAECRAEVGHLVEAFHPTPAVGHGDDGYTDFNAWLRFQHTGTKEPAISDMEVVKTAVAPVTNDRLPADLTDYDKEKRHWSKDHRTGNWKYVKASQIERGDLDEIRDAILKGTASEKDWELYWAFIGAQYDKGTAEAEAADKEAEALFGV